MKIAFTTAAKTFDGELDGRFGRSPGFLIVDTATSQLQFIDNQQSLDSAQGAGIQAAQIVARAGAEAVVTRHCGPKAYKVLQAASIKVFNTDLPTVDAALKAIEDGTLQPASSADVEGHWV